MRVLMLGWELPPRASGGLGTACRGLTRGLSSAGTDVVFVVPHADDVPREGGRVVAADRVPVLDSGRWAASGARTTLALEARLDPYSGRAFRRDAPSDWRAELERYARAVGEVARLVRPDVIHAHDWMSFPAGAFARELTGRPLVAHVHSTERDRAGAAAEAAVEEIERRGIVEADVVVCVSNATRDAVIERYGADPRRVRVVHNAVEPPPEDAPREPLRTRRRVLFLGRVTGQKDPATFLRAAALVAERLPDVEFVVAGDGDLLPDMVALVGELGLRERVRFAGFLGEEDVERMYGSADVFVLCSRAEPFGLTALEAAVRGLPVIAARGAGVLETLHSALVVEPGDAAELAEAIVAVLTRPALRSALLGSGEREAGGARWEHRGRELTALYRELAG